MAWGVAYFSDALEGWLLGVARGAGVLLCGVQGWRSERQCGLVGVRLLTSSYARL